MCIYTTILQIDKSIHKTTSMTDTREHYYSLLNSLPRLQTSWKVGRKIDTRCTY